MPFSDTYRRDLVRLQDREASLRKEFARFESDAAKADESARRNYKSASRASSPSSVNSYLNSVERDRKKAIDASKRAADIQKKLADNARDQANKKRSLESAEKSERQALDREADGRRRKEKDHARQIAKLKAPTIHFVHIRPPEPEKLRVLYLTANPGLDLRTESEIRLVQQALRGAKFRELVEVNTRTAATYQDLLDGLNDVRPHVVHFSGHGGNQTILLEGSDSSTVEEHLVGFELLAKALDATDQPPTLLVLNACDTLDGAESILPSVPVVIAMANDILDLAAGLFAQQFYAALASGQSVLSAIKQAKAKIDSIVIDEDASSLIQHVARKDLSIENLVLVKA